MATDISTGDVEAALEGKGAVIDFKKAREKRDADLLETANWEDASFQKFAINLRPVNDEETGPGAANAKAPPKKGDPFGMNGNDEEPQP